MRLTAADILGDIATGEFRNIFDPVRPEKVMVRPAPRIMRRAWGRKTGAMTLGRLIYISPDILDQGGPRLRQILVHELIHARQWKEMGTVGFLVTYLRQYLVGRLCGSSHQTAYRSIDAEVEARRAASQVQRSLDNQLV